MECNSGSVVAQGRTQELRELCSWFCLMFLHSHGRGREISLYELAFIYLGSLRLILLMFTF